MTRIVGHQVIKTLCCGVRLSTTAFASINFIANEYWTDGRVAGNLYPTDGGLRRCICGSFFLISKCELCELIRKKELFSPATRNQQIEAWLRKQDGESTSEAMERLFGFRREITIEAISIPPIAEHVSDAELPELLESNITDHSLLIVARRRYWRYLNDAYRNIYRSHKEKTFLTSPEFKPSTSQIDNMLQLKFMLENDQSSDQLEIIELYRELSNFEKSLELLKKNKDQSHFFIRLTRKLINEEIAGPVRYRHIT